MKEWSLNRMLFAWEKANRLIRRKSARVLFRKPLPVRIGRGLISFSFDDFPRSALLSGGEILKRYGLAGTYYTALGLLGGNSSSGPLFVEDDLKSALADGHELGCHTFSHFDSWETGTREFEDSVKRNLSALHEIVPGTRFRSFSFPMSEPHPLSKRAVARHFDCCRSGGQRINAGAADLNQLFAYFLEKTQGELSPVRELIELNKRLRGWLIFATHDISPSPSPYGCTPEFFEEVVRCSVDSNAQILPVARALDVIQGTAAARLSTPAADCPGSATADVAVPAPEARLDVS